MELTADCWAERRVFVTGHTGFKGAWLCELLNVLGARVAGYALEAPTVPALFEQLDMAARIDRHIIADVADADLLRREIQAFQPEVIFHLAAQPLVRRSYAAPVETFRTNVMGTVHLLEGARTLTAGCAIVVITTDKCYENHGRPSPYKEDELLGGVDPYSSSKACAELVTTAFRRSFFSEGTVRVATARAGNVIGGGDWADDRLLPDAVRAFATGMPLKVRYPDAVRPWQHVLEPLRGYLHLARRLNAKGGERFAQAWNFGPDLQDCRPVRWVMDQVCELWGERVSWIHDAAAQPHEAGLLSLDCSKARAHLAWQPTLPLTKALTMTVDWYRGHLQGMNLRSLTRQQIQTYLTTGSSS